MSGCGNPYLNWMNVAILISIEWRWSSRRNGKKCQAGQPTLLIGTSIHTWPVKALEEMFSFENQPESVSQFCPNRWKTSLAILCYHSQLICLQLSVRINWPKTSLSMEGSMSSLHHPVWVIIATIATGTSRTWHHASHNYCVRGVCVYVCLTHTYTHTATHTLAHS